MHCKELAKKKTTLHCSHPWEARNQQDLITIGSLLFGTEKTFTDSQCSGSRDSAKF